MQGLAEHAQKRADTIHQAKHYRLKAVRLEDDLKKAKEDAVRKDLDHTLKEEVLTSHLRGTLCQPVESCSSLRPWC